MPKMVKSVATDKAVVLQQALIEIAEQVDTVDAENVLYEASKYIDELEHHLWVQQSHNENPYLKW